MPENKKSLKVSKKYTANKTTASNEVKESAAAYAKKHSNNLVNGTYSNLRLSPKNENAILAQNGTKPERQMTSLEKMSSMRLGISKKDLENLKDKAKLDYDKLAKALSVTRATLINKKKQEKFNAALSERIISLADIYSYGYNVFEDEVRFNTWMFKPNQALGGQSPYDLIDNQFGREEVKNLIGRIDYGVYS